MRTSRSEDSSLEKAPFRERGPHNKPYETAHREQEPPEPPEIIEVRAHVLQQGLEKVRVPLRQKDPDNHVEDDLPGKPFAEPVDYRVLFAHGSSIGSSASSNSSG